MNKKNAQACCFGWMVEMNMKTKLQHALSLSLYLSLSFSLSLVRFLSVSTSFKFNDFFAPLSALITRHTLLSKLAPVAEGGVLWRQENEPTTFEHTHSLVFTFSDAFLHLN